MARQLVVSLGFDTCSVWLTFEYFAGWTQIYLPLILVWIIIPGQAAVINWK